MLSHFYSVLTEVLTGLVADLIAKLLRVDVIDVIVIAIRSATNPVKTSVKTE